MVRLVTYCHFLSFLEASFTCGFNPFAANAPFLYPLETENCKVFRCFQAGSKGALGTN